MLNSPDNGCFEYLAYQIKGGVMGSLNKQGGGKPKEKSKLITIALPANNNVFKTDIDAELNNGWHIADCFYDSSRDNVRIIFTKPKRN